MWKRLLKRRVAAFERTFDYDASYMKEVLDVSPRAFLKLGRLQPLASHREEVPVAPWYAAKIVAARHEDCGPCTQLVVNMAEREGVSPGVLRAILRDDREFMGPDVTLAVDFTRATLARDPAADGLRQQVEQRWGRRGLVALAFGIAGSRLYPMVKYALGHGVACTRVTVGGMNETLAVTRAQPAA